MALARAPANDELDPELASLPDPPRQTRAVGLFILALAGAVALAMVVSLRRDVAYALVRAAPIDLGDLRMVTLSSAYRHDGRDNEPVRGEGVLAPSGGIRYERLLGRDTFRVAPVAGRRDLWVEVRVASGEEDGRSPQVPRAFSGRLVRFAEAGPRHRGLARAIEEATGEPVPTGAWLLVDGEDPARSRWVLVLATTFLGFASWHAAVIARMLRKAR
jgi:hypothetical protein